MDDKVVLVSRARGEGFLGQLNWKKSLGKLALLEGNFV